MFSLDLVAAMADFGQDDIDTDFVDRAQASGGNAQLDPAVFAGDPEATLVDVRVELAAGGIVGVRDVVTAHHALAGHLADTAHTYLGIDGSNHGPVGFGPCCRGCIECSEPRIMA